MRYEDLTVEEKIKHLEEIGEIDPNCEYCKRIFYPQYEAGNKFVFAPRHKASSRCQSGKHTHCTCDTCF